MELIDQKISQIELSLVRLKMQLQFNPANKTAIYQEIIQDLNALAKCYQTKSDDHIKSNNFSFKNPQPVKLF